MELEGTVRNGVIVVDGSSPLVEGTKVRITIETPGEPSRNLTLRERLLRTRWNCRRPPAGYRANHDHYIHGTPKR